MIFESMNWTSFLRGEAEKRSLIFLNYNELCTYEVCSRHRSVIHLSKPLHPPGARIQTVVRRSLKPSPAARRRPSSALCGPCAPASALTRRPSGPDARSARAFFRPSSEAFSLRPHRTRHMRIVTSWTKLFVIGGPSCILHRCRSFPRPFGRGKPTHDTARAVRRGGMISIAPWS